MAIESQNVTEGQTMLAQHYNDLRRDILQNHDHSEGKGGVVNHADLLDGVIPGTYLDHAAINTHVQGAGTNADPDAVGGSMGVHGLAAAAFVLGAMEEGYVMQVGSGSTSGSVEIDAGWIDNTGSVSFPTPFSSAPYVFIVPTYSTWAPRIMVTSVTASGFGVRIGFNRPESLGKNPVSVGFSWLAIGLE